jgi:MFS family permease
MQPADKPQPEPATDGSAFREGLPAQPASTAVIALQLPWYKELTGYQWFVFIVCCLAWDMDCMDQQLFNLARRPAMQELVAKVQPTDARLPELKEQLQTKATGPVTEADVLAAQQNADIGQAAGIATSIFMIGWAVGGIGFGVMGDRVGRVKTLMLTILLYAIFTGLSALARSTLDFYT